jgi:hypothetical protein
MLSRSVTMAGEFESHPLRSEALKAKGYRVFSNLPYKLPYKTFGRLQGTGKEPADVGAVELRPA